jgi:hypothetical protein
MMPTERMPGWEGACQNRVLMGRNRQSISNPTDGEDIVEVCIRLQSPHDLSIRHGHVMVLTFAGLITRISFHPETKRLAHSCNFPLRAV